MKKSIWKFPLEVKDVQEIEIPVGSAILSLHTQNGEPFLWALVYDTEEREILKLRTLGTGAISDDDFDPIDFLGTYQLNGGTFVGHVFQISK